MAPPYWLPTTDYHTAGEPFRIVNDVPSGHLTKGLTVSQQRLAILEDPSHPLDLLRRTLCHEPRGHADMYGCFITPPDDSGAHFGVLFWHKDGFSTACGHGTIALGQWAIAEGAVKREGSAEEVDVIIDVPSGRVVARVALNSAGDVQHVDFINVASQQISAGHHLSVSLLGPYPNQIPITIDLAFSGAVYASINTSTLNLPIEPSNYHSFVDFGRQVKAAFSNFRYKEKYDLYGVVFFENVPSTPTSITQRNVVVFADGQVDRSPCGSGTCARLAILLAQGEVGVDRRLVHESILGTKFEAFVTETGAGDGKFPTCIPRVRGKANLVGKMNFFIDPSDPVYPGFVFR
jgi:trans-L-3-hydroxyproline dehydratase